MRKTLPPQKNDAAKTVGDFLAGLEESNTTLASWAREKGLCVSTVYMVTRGRCKGRSGKARDVMKAMGVNVPPMFRASGVVQ